MVLNVKLDEGIKMPERAYKTDAGLDIFCPFDFDIRKGKWGIVDTGVHVEIPEGYTGFLKSKSGLNVKHGIIGEGVIDCGYTGSIVVKLYNLGERDYRFKKGDKMIQLVILPISAPEIKLVNEFAESERGENGFGSTGKR